MHLLWIALAGGLGALSRYGITVGMRRAFGPELPYGTFVANALGCALIGVFMVLNVESDLVPKALRVPITVGFLGALTTFSTFSYDTVRLIELGSWKAAATNVLANLAVGLPATMAGLAVTKRLVSPS